MDEYVNHIRHEFEILIKEASYENKEKCNFGMDHVVFLIFVMSFEEVHVMNKM